MERVCTIRFDLYLHCISIPGGRNGSSNPDRLNLKYPNAKYLNYNLTLHCIAYYRFLHFRRCLFLDSSKNGGIAVSGQYIWRTIQGNNRLFINSCIDANNNCSSLEAQPYIKSATTTSNYTIYHYLNLYFWRYKISTGCK